MRAAVVLLERSALIPKSEWRDTSCRRTLAPIEVGRLITSAWAANRLVQGCIVMSLQPDGAPAHSPSIHPMQDDRKGFVGVFDVTFTSPETVKVTLREEECSRRIGSPKRRTRQIALLRPWKPIRILLNGRSSSYSGQHYLLREYHLALCTDPVPARLGPTRFVDLQADLF